MKLVLSESQYNRIFNNKKRKMVVTESQYDRLLNESDLSSDFSKIKKFDIIKIDMDDSRHSTLHFRVMSIKSDELIMINCNNGVYKNAYFYINKSDYSSGSLKYKIAQDKSLEGKKNVWNTIQNAKLWRSSTFNKITGIDIYVDGEQDCNLSDNANKKLSIVDDSSKDNDNDDENSKDKAFELFKDVKPKHKYEITIGEYVANEKREKYTNQEIGSIIINVVDVSDNKISFKVLKTEGKGAKEYDDLFDKSLIFVNELGSIRIKNTSSKADFKLFDIIIGVKEGDDKDNVSKDIIADIMDFKLIGPYDGDEDDEEVGLSREEIKKSVEEDDILKDMIQKSPWDFVSFITNDVVRKKGIIPSQEVFSKWGADDRERSVLSGFNEGDKIEFKFGDDFKLERVGAEDKLKKFESLIRSKKDNFIAQVGRYLPGDKYMTLRGEKFDGVNYGLRLYGDNNSTNKDVIEVKIVLYDKNGGNPDIIAKNKIKIISNKSKKK